MEKDALTHRIIGAAMEVHRTLGPSHLEAVYHEALEIEFRLKRIPYVSKPKPELEYKEHKLRSCYVPDFLVFGEIVVEIKALSALGRVDEAQILNSVKCCKERVGLLINFGECSFVICEICGFFFTQ